MMQPQALRQIQGRSQLAEKVKAGAILFEGVALLPDSLRFESERCSNSGRSDADVNGYELDRRIHQAGRAYFCEVLGPQATWLLCLYLIAAVACASAQNGNTVPAVETILAQMAQARADNRARFRPFVVTRNYRLYGKERYKTKAQVMADVNFVPPAFKDYSIEQTSGTGLGERIVRRMLESEAEVAKDYSSTDISPDNYHFRFLREEQSAGGQHCYVLELLPRRKDKKLLRGMIWVDTSTHLLRRVEGEPAKHPSWWLREVRIVLLYSDVAGMWLQTASESTAKVRILGQHRMVSYDVKYKFSEPLAAGSPIPIVFLKHRPNEFLRNRLADPSSSE
jgi:hypothetical protein